MTSNPDARPDWESFLHALLDTLEAHMPVEERAVLLRAIGAQIAALSPLPAEETLSGLEARMNERLSRRNWGTVSLALDSEGPALVLTHASPPALPAIREGGGDWMGPVLEGLHGGWIGAQPGAGPEVGTHLVGRFEDRVVLRYGA